MRCSAALPVLLLLMSACGHRIDTRYAAGLATGVECAPFARAVTGIALSGPAADWWPAAAGRYRRDSVPAPGSVLVFRRSARLPSGHVSVVVAVTGARSVLLTQANWLHGRIGIDQPAVDVSPRNDWSAVRVYWPPSGLIGTTVYATDGFILPDALPDRASIDAAARRIAAR